MSCDYVELAAPGVQGLRPYQPGKPISELEREYGVSDIIKLASNENPLGPSPKALEAMAEVVGDLARYPDGNGFELKAALAARHSIDSSWITLGNGSNDVLVLLAESFLTPEYEAIYSKYAFAVYPLAVQAVGATARVAETNPMEHEMPLGHDLEAMTALINDKTRLIFIANPNNPTGTWLARDELKDFISEVPEQIVVIVDEAYLEYVEESEYPDCSTWIAEFPNLVVTRTFSKIYGLAGIRIGYALSHPDIANVLNRIRQPFNTNSLAQAAALASLGDSEHIERSRQINKDGLEHLTAAGESLGLFVLPSVGNFLLVDMGQPAGPLFEALLREAVIVRPVANYGLPNHLRITVGTPSENDRLVSALNKVLG
ncbi:MAG: histidinol-phosphate transaminase [Gammaproteobacteria bacterium]